MFCRSFLRLSVSIWRRVGINRHVAAAPVVFHTTSDCLKRRADIFPRTLAGRPLWNEMEKTNQCQRWVFSVLPFSSPPPFRGRYCTEKCMLFNSSACLKYACCRFMDFKVSRLKASLLKLSYTICLKTHKFFYYRPKPLELGKTIDP